MLHFYYNLLMELGEKYPTKKNLFLRAAYVNRRSYTTPCGFLTLENAEHFSWFVGISDLNLDHIINIKCMFKNALFTKKHNKAESSKMS